jgi:hypothetical protein
MTTVRPSTEKAERHIADFIASAQWRGDDICADIMDSMGIKRSPGNYVRIINLLAKYRRRIQRGKK